MPFSLVWLPGVLEAAGLKVSRVDGWETRGRGDMGQVSGVICHHTVGPKTGNMPSLNVIKNGRPDLPGPLAQLGLGRDGTYYVVAAGRCNHAGKGIWRGLTNGNSNFIGIEAENTGVANDFPWPAVQVDAYARGVAAILKHIGKGAEFCAGHKEYALPHGRKSDPNFDMNAFRASVDRFLQGAGPAPDVVPKTEPAGAKRPTLRRDIKGAKFEPFIKQLQTKLAVTADSDFGPKTEAALRKFQTAQNLTPDGICGPKTWAAIDKAP